MGVPSLAHFGLGKRRDDSYYVPALTADSRTEDQPKANLIHSAAAKVNIGNILKLVGCGRSLCSDSQRTSQLRSTRAHDAKKCAINLVNVC